MQLQVIKQGKSEDAYTNRVFVSAEDFEQLVESRGADADAAPTEGYVRLTWDKCRDPEGWVFTVAPQSGVHQGQIALNGLHRVECDLGLDERIMVEAFHVDQDIAISKLVIAIDLHKKQEHGPVLEVPFEKLQREFNKNLMGQVFTEGQQLYVRIKKNLIATITNIEVGDGLGGETRPARRGLYGRQSELDVVKAPGVRVHVSGRDDPSTKIFNKEFDFNRLGIGGLDKEFTNIFRRAFASRLYPNALVEAMGIQHVRGMLLFGPPGCGKTLIARKIGEVLNARPPKIVNGPEILDKFVGGSEEKIRALFADAEKEQETDKENSMLHIIIFDEFDAICKARGATNDNTGVHDSIVNQLLAKIDGVESLNNILIIGMTNRKDMIDEAILRPGRLEVHVEIGLPDTDGRLAILNIHTAKMRLAHPKRLTPEAEQRLPELAEATKNYSGAELAGLVRSAQANALHRALNAKTMEANVENVQVIWKDFEMALTEVQPAFGVPTEDLEALFPPVWVSFNSEYDELLSQLRRCVEQVNSSERTNLLSVLLKGAEFTGKTSLAARIAVESKFPFVRMISADGLIGMGDIQKSIKIRKVFQDAAKSPFSVILLDDLERIIEYSPVGMRFSNMILQTLLVMLKKAPSKGSSLLVVATTSARDALDTLQLTSAFNITFTVPQLDAEGVRKVLSDMSLMQPDQLEEVCEFMKGKRIPIKQLLLVAEMARQSEDEEVTALGFMTSLAAIDYVPESSPAGAF